MPKIIILLVLNLFLFFKLSAQYTYPFQNPELDEAERIDNLLSLLTPEEKLSWMDQHQPAIERLDIPYFTTWTEGLHGLAWAETGTVIATQFPQAKGLANTWSPEIMVMTGHVEGYEARVYYEKYDGDGIGLVIRAPVLDIGRDIRWGRTEESLGEDPHLVSVMGKGMVRGLQGDHPDYLMTATTLKHFLAYNNETNRDITSSDFDERNLREYYLPPFREALTNANARSLMTAYNLINDVPAIVSPLINDVVIGEWGFDGMICTDAFAYYNVFGSQNYYSNGVKASAEIVLAGTSVFVDHDQSTLEDAYDNGLITVNDIDRVMRGNVRLRFQLGLFDPSSMVPYDSISANDDPWLTAPHQQKALTAAEKSVVLLKNEDSTLPLNMDSIQSVALIGPNASDVYPDWYGGNPPYKVSILDGLQKRAGDSLHIAYAADNKNNQAVHAADTCDIVILCLGNHPTCGSDNWAECESDYEGRETADRKYIALKPKQVAMAQEVYEANPNTVVIMVSSYPQAINWIQDTIPAIMHITHSAQEQGNAVARALFGDVNPGGKTVFTWLTGTDEIPDLLDYNIRNNRTYMYYDGEPLYPFGHGLSYTSFDMHGLTIPVKSLSKDDTIKISLTLENTGEYEGDEVVQVYARFLNSSVKRPQKELNAFERITVNTDTSAAIRLKIPVHQLHYWNEAEQSFYIEETDIEIQVGNSSSNILLRDTISITQGGKIKLVSEPEQPVMITGHTNSFNTQVINPYGTPNLKLSLEETCNVNLTIYNTKGTMIERIPNLHLSAGRHNIKLNNNTSVPGLYIVRGSINNQLFTHKFIVK